MLEPPTSSDLKSFQNFILNWHQRYGRHDLPWRKTYNPYSVLVSEIMLQQTQVHRVVPKFEAFLEEFPHFDALAAARPSQVITAWQGLGYNRRGLFLQKTAQAVVQKWQGEMPYATADLLALPGVGPYTASAVQAFAFNLPVTVIETNVRAIFIYHFFAMPAEQAQLTKIPDAHLEPLVAATVPNDNPRIWYSALMDYGSHLKTALPNPSRRSSSHAKQSKFQGSFRQLRGHILRILSQEALGYQQLAENSPSSFSPQDVQLALEQLTKEGFITRTNQQYHLKDHG